jgi:hypothetical protein
MSKTEIARRERTKCLMPNRNLLGVSKKRCPCCSYVKPKDAFGTDGYRKQEGRADVSWRCRACRSDAYFTNRYGAGLKKCCLCKHARPLDRNGVCRACNRESGLKQCSSCKHLLPFLLEFYGRQSKCRRCISSAAKSARGRARVLSASPALSVPLASEPRAREAVSPSAPTALSAEADRDP